MKKIIIADDVDINRSILRDIFEEQFEILEAADGSQAIELLDTYTDSVALLFLDLIMPNKSGMDVLVHMNATDMIQSIPVIIITGEASTESDVHAYELGAADIIHKPFARRIVLRRTLDIIELYEHRIDIERKLEERTTELNKTRAEIEKHNEFLINALSSVVEFRSLESGEHVNRVKKFTGILLKTWKTLHPDCELTNEDIACIVQASSLHDIGKIGIPDSILLKPGRLTPEEFAVMKTHTTLGCEILERFKQEESDFYRYSYDICRHHHERWDGKGYPDGLKGNDIPLCAQIVSAVDVYDALVSPRVYKAAYTPQDAYKMIYNGECGAFNPEVLECMDAAKFEIFLETNAMSDQDVDLPNVKLC